jgi:oligopeptidase B
MDLKTHRPDYYITFPEPAYAVSPTQNFEFNTNKLRFVYSSLLTPSSTYDYDMSTRKRELLKKIDVPNFDPNKYQVRRFMVRARDGAMVPVSMISLKTWKQDGTQPLLVRLIRLDDRSVVQL